MSNDDRSHSSESNSDSKSSCTIIYESTFKKNDIIWAKVRGYAPWPAWVTKVEFTDAYENGPYQECFIKYHVEFFGDQTIQVCKFENVSDFKKDFKQNCTKKVNKFIKAVREAIDQFDGEERLELQKEWEEQELLEQSKSKNKSQGKKHSNQIQKKESTNQQSQIGVSSTSKKEIENAKTPIGRFNALDESDWDSKSRKKDDPLNDKDGSGSKDKRNSENSRMPGRQRAHSDILNLSGSKNSNQGIQNRSGGMSYALNSKHTPRKSSKQHKKDEEMLFKSHSERDSQARHDNSDRKDKSGSKGQHKIQKDILASAKEVQMDVDGDKTSNQDGQASHRGSQDDQDAMSDIGRDQTQTYQMQNKQNSRKQDQVTEDAAQSRGDLNLTGKKRLSQENVQNLYLDSKSKQKSCENNASINQILKKRSIKHMGKDSIQSGDDSPNYDLKKQKNESYMEHQIISQSDNEIKSKSRLLIDEDQKASQKIQKGDSQSVENKHVMTNSGSVAADMPKNLSKLEAADQDMEDSQSDKDQQQSQDKKDKQSSSQIEESKADPKDNQDQAKKGKDNETESDLEEEEVKSANNKKDTKAVAQGKGQTSGTQVADKIGAKNSYILKNKQKVTNQQDILDHQQIKNALGINDAGNPLRKSAIACKARFKQTSTRKQSLDNSGNGSKKDEAASTSKHQLKHHNDIVDIQTPLALLENQQQSSAISSSTKNVAQQATTGSKRMQANSIKSQKAKLQQDTENFSESQNQPSETNTKDKVISKKNSQVFPQGSASARNNQGGSVTASKSQRKKQPQQSSYDQDGDTQYDKSTKKGHKEINTVNLQHSDELYNTENTGNTASKKQRGLLLQYSEFFNEIKADFEKLIKNYNHEVHRIKDSSGKDENKITPKQMIGNIFKDKIVKDIKDSVCKMHVKMQEIRKVSSASASQRQMADFLETFRKVGIGQLIQQINDLCFVYNYDAKVAELTKSVNQILILYSNSVSFFYFGNDTKHTFEKDKEEVERRLVSNGSLSESMLLKRHQTEKKNQDALNQQQNQTLSFKKRENGKFVASQMQQSSSPDSPSKNSKKKLLMQQQQQLKSLNKQGSQTSSVGQMSQAQQHQQSHNMIKQKLKNLDMIHQYPYQSHQNRLANSSSYPNMLGRRNTSGDSSKLSSNQTNLNQPMQNQQMMFQNTGAPNFPLINMPFYDLMKHSSTGGMPQQTLQRTTSQQSSHHYLKHNMSMMHSQNYKKVEHSTSQGQAQITSSLSKGNLKGQGPSGNQVALKKSSSMSQQQINTKLTSEQQQQMMPTQQNVVNINQINLNNNLMPHGSNSHSNHHSNSLLNSSQAHNFNTFQSLLSAQQHQQAQQQSQQNEIQNWKHSMDEVQPSQAFKESQMKMQQKLAEMNFQDMQQQQALLEQQRFLKQGQRNQAGGNQLNTKGLAGRAGMYPSSSSHNPHHQNAMYQNILSYMQSQQAHMQNQQSSRQPNQQTGNQGQSSQHSSNQGTGPNQDQQSQNGGPQQKRSQDELTMLKELRMREIDQMNEMMKKKKEFEQTQKNNRSEEQPMQQD